MTGIDHLERLDGERPPVVAYVSAGDDAGALAALHPVAMRQWDSRPFAAPELFVHVDARDAELNLDELPRDFGAQQIAAREAISWMGIEGHRTRFEVWSMPRQAPHEVTVVQLQATNAAFSLRAARAGFTPDILIVKCCGCRNFGQNHRCELQLGVPPAASGWGPPYRWLIADGRHVGVRRIEGRLRLEELRDPAGRRLQERLQGDREPRDLFEVHQVTRLHPAWGQEPVLYELRLAATSDTAR